MHVLQNSTNVNAKISLFLYTNVVLESKASKGIQPGLYWKITCPPLIYTSALKIVPLVVRYTPRVLENALICSILFILNQSGQLKIKEKNNNIFFAVVNLFFKALNFRSWQVPRSFDFGWVLRHTETVKAIWRLSNIPGGGRPQVPLRVFLRHD